MAKRPIPSVAADFAQVVEFLKERQVLPATPPATTTASARSIHRATYSLILWRFRLRRLPEHGKVFVEEIASDAIQLLPQVLMGYGKTVKLLTRGLVENTLRHIYFSDHPIEFERMNRGAKWYIGTDELFDYAKAHPVFAKTEPLFDALSRLRALHDELSAGVHGRRVSDLEMRVALRKIVYVDETGKREVALIERCAAAVNFCLAIFHRDQMASFTSEDRRIILQTMPPKAREVWSEWT